MTSKNRFNLIDEQWIPVVDFGLVSLKDIFSCSDYRALGGNPIQKIALTKLLLAIAQAASTPEDDEDWSKSGAEGMAQTCLAYLARWYDRFWLYGERPFLQIPTIRSAKIQSFGAVLPGANVFVSGVKDSVGKAVVEYLYQHCPPESGLMVFRRINETPGYEIRGVGDTRRSIIEISGLQLVQEKVGEEEHRRELK